MPGQPKVASDGAGYALVFRNGGDSGVRASGATWSSPRRIAPSPSRIGYWGPLTSVDVTFGGTDYVTAWPQLPSSASTPAHRINATQGL